MFKKFVALTILVGGMSACTAEVEMPAASVTKYDDGTIIEMSGQLFGRMDGASRTFLQNEEMTCEMEMARQSDGSAAGVMNCVDPDGALIMSQPQHVAAEEYSMSFNGTMVSAVETPIGPAMNAFGWGNKADFETLRGLLE